MGLNADAWLHRDSALQLHDNPLSTTESSRNFHRACAIFQSVAMLCASKSPTNIPPGYVTLAYLSLVSGEAPQEPVISKKSGIVYEKRLIEKYISENATEPDTGEALTEEDLLPIKNSRIVRPRPATLTSIPALLKTFQDEWDTLSLEVYNTKEQLARTREELTTALYQHDAAVRVIARLTRERDEARESLSKVTVMEGAGNGDDMQVDSVEALPEELSAKVQETQQRYVIKMGFRGTRVDID